MRRKEIAARFDEIVAFAGVERFLDTPVKRYSSGMYVRLAFAVAAHLEPEILIVDEVLAVGDSEFQRKCIGKMEEVAHAGRTVLFVSHNMQAIATLTKRTLVLDRGACVFDGSASDGIAHYRTMQSAHADTAAAYRAPPETKGEQLFRTMQATLISTCGGTGGACHVSGAFLGGQSELLLDLVTGTRSVDFDVDRQNRKYR